MGLTVRALTTDGKVGWDKLGQLWHTASVADREVYHLISDVRTYICPVCNHGWDITSESLADQCYWYIRKQWAHLSCYVRYLAIQDHELFYRALSETQIYFESLEPIQNQYWSRDDVWGRLRPWYLVQVLDLPFKIVLGRRKRVYSLEISGHFSIEQAKELFREEDVTKSFSTTEDFDKAKALVHAWSDTKLVQYLRCFKCLISTEHSRAI
jgi:hypothetical protein